MLLSSIAPLVSCSTMRSSVSAALQPSTSLAWLLVALTLLGACGARAQNVTEVPAAECGLVLPPLAHVDNSTWTKCVDEQGGLEDVLEQIKEMASWIIGEQSLPFDAHLLLTLMDDLEYSETALALRKCIARENEQVTAGGSFNMTALQEQVLEAVAGTDLQDNVNKGIAECPAVEDFNVQHYLLCIVQYCIYGEGWEIPSESWDPDWLY